MRLRNKRVIWPSNISKKRSRREGRRLPRRLAVESPTLDEMATAARRLGLNVEVFREKSMPSHPWVDEGYIVVDGRESKRWIFVMLAEEIRGDRVAVSKG